MQIGIAIIKMQINSVVLIHVGVSLKKKAKTGKDNIRSAMISKILNWKIIAVDLPIAIFFIFK